MAISGYAQSLSGGGGGDMELGLPSGGVGGVNSVSSAGGDGGISFHYGGGGGGGAGVTGGAGGNSQSGGGVGGAGGATPGAAGAAGTNIISFDGGGGGGGGAAGAVITSTTNNSSVISGGAGGAGAGGGVCCAFTSGGGGGAGGYGAIVNAYGISFTNSGSIFGGAGGAGGTYNDSGLMPVGGNGGSGGIGVYLGNVTNLINSGVIAGGNGGAGGVNDGYFLFGNGTNGINGNSAPGIYISSTGTSIISNTGTITGGLGSYGVWNDGVITILNNGQGAGNVAGALTYTGVLPLTYNIIISGSSNYGKLSVTSGVGTTTFGIYAGSILTRGIYSSVLSGVSSSNLNNSSGNFNGYKWTLTNSSSSLWDLVVTGASSADTQSSMQLSANRLKSTYALQTASITNGLTYDCNVFDKEGICVSAGGRYDRVNTGDTHATNGLLIGSYKVDANTRVGAWVDQNLSASSATGVNLNNGNPMFGVFGVWNADKSGNGFEARLSAGYGDKDLTTARQVIGTSEAGTGKTRLNTQGVSAVVSYNLPVAADLTVSPYLGARYTRVNANAYTEATSSAVTAPLTYGALKQETTTAMAGLKASARMSPECGVFGSVGAELDTNNQGNNYSATGVTGLTPIPFNDNAKRLRGVASVGTYYDLDKTQRISLNAVYREEAFQKVNTLSTMATYTAGF